MPSLKAFDHIHTVALIANGAIHDYDLMGRLVKEYERVVAVDGGLLHCHRMNIRPDLIIGDFDSTPHELLEIYHDIPSEKFPTDKDFTDIELAFEAVNSASVRKVGMFGVLEKRTDHALSNLLLMCCFPQKIIIESEWETMQAIKDYRTIVCRPGQVVSLIPLGPPAIATTHGLKWELNHATLDQSFKSISNICLGDHFEVQVDQGNLICCLLRSACCINL